MHYKVYHSLAVLLYMYPFWHSCHYLFFHSLLTHVHGLIFTSLFLLVISLILLLQLDITTLYTYLQLIYKWLFNWSTTLYWVTILS